MGHPSPPINGERSALTILVHTYHGACLLRHWAKHLHLERPRVELRRLCPALMAETSRRGLAAETEAMAMWMTWKVAATLTHSKLKVRSSLERVSTRTHTEDLKKTHLSCLGHPPIPQNPCMDPLDININAECSNTKQRNNLPQRCPCHTAMCFYGVHRPGCRCD